MHTDSIIRHLIKSFPGLVDGETDVNGVDLVEWLSNQFSKSYSSVDEFIHAEIGYNGWSNYETWAVNLWLSNDYADHAYWDEMAREEFDAAEPSECFTKAECAQLNLADRLKEEFDSANPFHGDNSIVEHLAASVWADLLNAAFSEINWYEIAGHLIDNAGIESNQKGGE